MKRPMLASSRAASTSSRTQKGLAAAKDREQQRHAGESFFAAGEERDAARLLARWAGDDFDAAFEYVVGFVDDDIGLAAAEEVAKQFLKVAADCFKRFGKSCRLSG